MNLDVHLNLNVPSKCRLIEDCLYKWRLVKIQSKQRRLSICTMHCIKSKNIAQQYEHFASFSLLRLYQWWLSYFYTINPPFHSHPNTLFLLPVQEFSHLPECRFMNIHQRFLTDWSSCFQICQLLELWHNICDLRHRKRKAIKRYTASLSHNVLALTKEKIM